MATYEKIKLSGTPGGNIPASTSSVYTLHVTTTASNVFDEIWLWASNDTGVAGDLYLEFFNGSSIINPIRFDVPDSGSVLILGGILLTSDSGGTSGINVYSMGGSVNVYGYVNRITT